MTPAELNNFKNGNPFLMSDPKYGINLSELTSDEYNAYHEELKWMQTSYNILQGNANQNDLDNISRIHFESLSWSKQQAIVSLIYLLSNSIERTSEQKENMSNIGVFDEGYSPELYLGAITRIKTLFPNIFVQTANTPIKVIHDLVNDNIYIPTNTIKLTPSSYFDFRINLSPNEKVQVATAKNNSLSQVLSGQDTFTWKELSNGDLINHVSLIQYLASYHKNNNSVYNITKDGTITLKPFNFSIEDKVELSYNPHFGYTISNSSLFNDINSSINSGLNNYLFSNPYVDEQNRNVAQSNSVFRTVVYGSSDYMGGATVPHSVYNDFAGQIKHAGYSPLPAIIYNIIPKSIQNLDVTFIDDTSQTVLEKITKTGYEGENTNYSTQKDISKYLKDGYLLVSDNSNGENLIFDNEPTIDQHYNVHLKHNTQNTSENIVKKLTVHYVYQDDTKAFEDQSGSPLTFTRTGIHDLVTNQITWNAWTPTQVFENIESPALAGYTPNIQTITNVSVNNTSPELTEKTVVYTPNTQLLTVKYIDDITGQVLKTVNKQGSSDSSAEYNTKNDIANYEKQNYVLIKDDTKGTNLIFDHNDNINQYYEVHLSHKYTTVNENKSINETIHYIYNGGKKALNDYHATPIQFTRSGNKDLITNNITWNNWQPSTASFDSVILPVIEGFTPNINKTNSIVVTPDDKDIDQTIVYSPDEQTIVINYIDQTNGKILTTDTLIGKSNDVSKYSTQNKINNYLQQNYTFIKDETNDKSLQFDHDSKVTQIYNVYLGHKTKAIQQQHRINENINYQYEDGTKAHETYVATPLTFTQTGTLDLVNGTITYNNDWTPTQSFAKVISPTISGYTPTKTSIDEIKVDHSSSDITINVIYKANNQTANIKYIDDTTGKTINVDNTTGYFNTPIEFTNNVQAQIKTYEKQGYKLVSNNFNNQKYQANNDQNQFEVHLVHNTINVQRNNTVNRTIKYQYSDGKQAANNKVQTVNFVQNGIKDEVTNNVNWLHVNTQNIPSVTTSTIKGYTPDVILVPEQNVSFNSKDQTIVVTYKANKQLAKISYIDDTTGKVLQTNEAKGSFDQLINFSTEPLVQINNYINQGYQLVSNNFNNQNYQANNNQNQFEVHLVHGTVNVKKENKVTRTINYVDSQTTILVHQPTVQTVIFVTTGVKDLVTNKTVWNTPDIQNFNSINSPLIEGYNIPDIETIEKQSINMNDSDQEITVHYDKIIPEQPFTNEFSSSSKHNNTPNTPSSAISVTNESSTPVSDQKVNLTKIYDPNNSIKTNTPTSFIAQSNDISSTHLNKNEKAPELPQTGNNNQNEMKVLGLAGLTLAGSLLLMKKKQKKN